MDVTMSIENITARILQEAKSEADAMLQKAEQEKAVLLEQAGQEAHTADEEMNAKARRDAEVLLERRASVAELEARKMRLAAKQEMIEESFEQALTHLANLPEQEYKAFLLRQLAPYRNQPGEIILNERDQAALGRELMRELTDSPLVVSEETVQIRGGFILQQGCVSLNASIEKILENEKKQLTAKIAETLFS